MNEYVDYMAGLATGQSDDARSRHRQRVLKRGMLGFGEQFAGQPCIIRDLSEIGAKIELQNIVALPRLFVLHIEIDGIQIDCRLVWQKPPFAGVEFFGEARASTLARRQTVGSSESALSETFMREFQMRQAREHRGQENIQSQNAGRSAKKPMRQFGKRAFKG